MSKNIFTDYEDRRRVSNFIQKHERYRDLAIEWKTALEQGNESESRLFLELMLVALDEGWEL